MSYNVTGTRGVRIELIGGEFVIMGSQRAGELAAAIGERIGSAKARAGRLNEDPD